MLTKTNVGNQVQSVADECKGLPLALKVIAGALAGKKAPGAWQLARKKLKQAEYRDNELEKMYHRLQFSYDALQSVELKKCFIYFAAFPEDSAVDSEKLVRLWAGEKMFQTGVDNDDDIYMDPLEEGYALLDELIERSLIELRSQEWSESLNRDIG